MAALKSNRDKRPLGLYFTLLCLKEILLFIQRYKEIRSRSLLAKCPFLIFIHACVNFKRARAFEKESWKSLHKKKKAAIITTKHFQASLSQVRVSSQLTNPDYSNQDPHLSSGFHKKLFTFQVSWDNMAYYLALNIKQQAFKCNCAGKKGDTGIHCTLPDSIYLRFSKCVCLSS